MNDEGKGIKNKPSCKQDSVVGRSRDLLFDSIVCFQSDSFIEMLYILYQYAVGHAVAQWVEELCYKPEGHRFNSRWGHWYFSLT